MKANTAWAGAIGCWCHISVKAPQPCFAIPGARDLTDTSQRLVRQLEVLILEIKFKKIMSHCPFLSARTQKSD